VASATGQSCPLALHPALRPAQSLPAPAPRPGRRGAPGADLHRSVRRHSARYAGAAPGWPGWVLLWSQAEPTSL